MSKQSFIKKKERNGSMLKITFQGDEMDPSLVNAIRRILMGELRTYSLMDNFTIHANTTMFNDEYLETRINMIPIFLKDPKNIKILDEKLVFKICEDGKPNEALVNTGDLDLMIKAHMLQVYDQYGNRVDMDIKDLIPYDFILLKMRKGEKFHMSVEVSDGIGRNHTSWKSCIATYKFENPVSTGEKKVSGKNPITKESHESIADKRGYSKNRWENPKNISLTLKSNGHYETEDCFLMALDTLEENLLSFRVLVDNPARGQDEDVTRVEIIPSSDIENYIQIKVMDPDRVGQPLATHTLGNLLANHMYYNLFDQVKGDLNRIRESMCSYRQPHPLDSIIYLHIKTPDGLYKNSDQNPSLKLLDETIDRLLGYIRKLRSEFKG